MTSCTVDESSDHVIIHYLNGATHKFNNVYVDCFVDWKNSELTLLEPQFNGDFRGAKHIYLTPDTMCVESRHSGSVTIWKNPKYKLSVKTDVMTAKQRARKNQWSIDSECRPILMAYEMGYSDAMETLGYTHVGYIGDDTDD